MTKNNIFYFYVG